MIRLALITVATLAALALVGTLTIAPSWPVVVALAVLAFLVCFVLAAILWSERDTRLDTEARKDAHRAKLIADEYILRLKAIEEWQRTAIAQRHAQAAQADWRRAANGAPQP